MNKLLKWWLGVLSPKYCEKCGSPIELAKWKPGRYDTQSGKQIEWVSVSVCAKCGDRAGWIYATYVGVMRSYVAPREYENAPNDQS